MQTGTVLTGVVDLDASRWWARRVQAIPRNCWWNAVAVVRRAKRDDWFYVEGVSVIQGAILTEHGFVVTSDGAVIDPTWIVLDEDCAAAPYGIGQVYARQELFRVRAERLPFWSRGAACWQWTAPMQQAYDAVHRIVYGATVAERMEQLCPTS